LSGSDDSREITVKGERVPDVIWQAVASVRGLGRGSVIEDTASNADGRSISHEVSSAGASA
jgi:hypothetical protein